MAAKARLVVADQNSTELEALRRSYNSLLLILANIATEVDASTITQAQGWTAIKTALTTGTDSTSAPHTGTGRLVYGVHPTPTHPSHLKEDATKLQTMNNSDKF